MTEIAEITLQDREKIKKYVESSNFLTYTMLAKRFGISKSELSLIINGKKTSAEANKIIDSIIAMYELWKSDGRDEHERIKNISIWRNRS